MSGSRKEDRNASRGPKSSDQYTPDRPTDARPTSARLQQGKTAMLPLRRPSDGASEEEQRAYRKERRRRVVVKATRRARIERRQTPHDSQACEVCKRSPKRVDDDYGVTPQQIAERAKVSPSHVYRVISDNPRTARGRRTLETLRRIAHDGLGVSLDELAAIVLD